MMNLGFFRIKFDSLILVVVRLVFRCRICLDEMVFVLIVKFFCLFIGFLRVVRLIVLDIFSC